MLSSIAWSLNRALWKSSVSVVALAAAAPSATSARESSSRGVSVGRRATPAYARTPSRRA